MYVCILIDKYTCFVGQKGEEVGTICHFVKFLSFLNFSREIRTFKPIRKCQSIGATKSFFPGTLVSKMGHPIGSYSNSWVFRLKNLLSKPSRKLATFKLQSAQ
jgi:hypothetical protein